jgi:hypothetical protein
MKIDIPKNTQPITEMYAVLSKDGTGDGVVSMMTEMGAMPLVFGYKDMLDKVRPVVQHIAKDTGMKFYIAKFTNKEILEVIE